MRRRSFSTPRVEAPTLPMTACASGGRTVAVGQPIQAAALDAPAGAGTPVRENRGPMVLVLVLAVWLGLATLNYSNSPPYLLALSLVASSLLFTSAWNMLQKGAT